MDMYWFPEDLLYKNIPLTLYVRTDNIMDKKCVFIAWDHNGMIIKYFSCVFEKVHVLNVSNLLEDLLYEDIPMELHVYDIQNYFDTI